MRYSWSIDLESLIHMLTGEYHDHHEEYVYHSTTKVTLLYVQFLPLHNIIVQYSIDKFLSLFSELNTPQSIMSHTLEYPSTQQTMDELEDELDVPLTQNAEIVLFLARGVGLLVAIVALLLCFMIMMIAKIFLSFLINNIGIIGVIVIISIPVMLFKKLRNISYKAILTILDNSCR